jgi:hypothetical protein
MGLVGLVLLAAATASGLTIDFSSGTYTTVVAGQPGGVYEEGGFSFAVQAGNHTDCAPTSGFGVPVGTYCFHNGGGNLNFPTVVTLSAGGAAFDFNSFDIVADPFNQNLALPPFTITISSSAGSVAVDGNSVGTVALNWIGVTSVTLVVNDDPTCNADSCRHNAAIDNVVLNQAVPEPRALALLTLAVASRFVGRLRR